MLQNMHGNQREWQEELMNEKQRGGRVYSNEKQQGGEGERHGEACTHTLTKLSALSDGGVKEGGSVKACAEGVGYSGRTKHCTRTSTREQVLEAKHTT
jgi:hypothetical protein